jgi:hypothetical protein
MPEAVAVEATTTWISIPVVVLQAVKEVSDFLAAGLQAHTQVALNQQM